jgi:hypothetical protein
VHCLDVNELPKVGPDSCITNGPEDVKQAFERLCCVWPSTFPACPPCHLFQHVLIVVSWYLKNKRPGPDQDKIVLTSSLPEDLKIDLIEGWWPGPKYEADFAAWQAAIRKFENESHYRPMCLLQ